MLTKTLKRLAVPAAVLAASAAFAVPAMAREAEPGDDRGGRAATVLPAGVPGPAPAAAEVRGRGREDARPHLRRARGRDDAAGHLRHGRGRDDAPGHVRGGGDDPAGHR